MTQDEAREAFIAEGETKRRAIETADLESRVIAREERSK